MREVRDAVLGLGHAVLGVDVDEVDVGREVQLARAELPHGEGAEPRAGLAPRQAGRSAVTRPQPAIVEPDGGVHAGGRERGELGRHLAHARAPQVAQGDAHDLARAQPPQQAVEPGRVVRVEARGGAGEEVPQRRLGARRVEVRRARGAPQEVRRAGEEARDHARRAAQERQRLQQVGLGRERARGVGVPLHAREREVGVRRGAAGRLEGGDAIGEAAPEPPQALGRIRRAERRGGKTGYRVRGHLEAAS